MQKNNRVLDWYVHVYESNLKNVLFLLGKLSFNDSLAISSLVLDMDPLFKIVDDLVVEIHA
jgi:hypothetical protein